jgi:hypothetical protein
MAQVGKEFTEIKNKVGAREAAEKLHISLPSFYKYAAGTNLPRMEVLNAASQLWAIKWNLIDPSEILRTKKAQSAEQYAFSFLCSLREDDVEITEVRPSRDGSLRLVLNISIPALQRPESARKNKH